jgi:prefoldin subunit 4
MQINAPFTQLLLLLLMISLQLSKEDEATAGGDEIEVRREDQDKINKFSRLHQKEIALEDELKTKHVSATSLDLRCSSELY